MIRRTATALVVPAALLVTLTGCTFGVVGGGSGSGSTPGADGGASLPADAALASCIAGDWHADLDDAASQIGSFLAGNGLNVTASTASGTQDLTVDADGLDFENAMTFVITIDTGDGIVMTVTQTHAGTVTAVWSWEGDPAETSATMHFSDFDNSTYTVQNTVDINGTAVSTPIEAPDYVAGDVPLEVTCSGDTMTTHPTESPFTTTWHR
ncbi:hypothetical protein [Protaetiibacter mangrovi]|uniref:Ig-like domain-containing protein n=1 Tax=Protaetiibacter mangrovi TaxID=2970926 RepID=A0ABT1ZEA3_9MICO|nr:hypothetical protein [Protaetiibacter mangrovi]MCS0499041.1 hypothetical protein [Protaetiibacter mangrovi]TPX02089.1 hypothetical protein FJ656_24185 [Schumannella luteola]